MFFDAYTGSVMAIAHRGARSLAPENTLPAVTRALETGAYAWETDVQMTLDGQLVITHDETLERTSNIAQLPAFADRTPWRVQNFTLAELKTLDVGSWYTHTDPFGQIASGSVPLLQAKSFRETPVLTLEEGLRFTREHGLRINVEIKDLSGTPGDEVVTRKVMEMIRRFDLVEQTILSSFQFRYLQEAKNLLPELPLAALMEEENMPADGDILTLLHNLNAEAWHPDKEILRDTDLHRVLDDGVYVNVYTVNDVLEMQNLIASGVTGLITDFPQRVREAEKTSG